MSGEECLFHLPWLTIHHGDVLTNVLYIQTLYQILCRREVELHIGQSHFSAQQRQSCKLLSYHPSTSISSLLPTSTVSRPARFQTIVLDHPVLLQLTTDIAVRFNQRKHPDRTGHMFIWYNIEETLLFYCNWTSTIINYTRHY